MSFLQNILSNVKNLFGEEEKKQEDKDQKAAPKQEEKSHDEIIESITSRGDAKKQILKAVDKAAEDGVITKAELEEIQNMKEKLEISDEELSQAKVKVFRKMVDKVLADNVVTDKEMETLNELQKGLDFNDSEMIRLLGDFQKVQLIYQNS